MVFSMSHTVQKVADTLYSNHNLGGEATDKIQGTMWMGRTLSFNSRFSMGEYPRENFYNGTHRAVAFLYGVGEALGVWGQMAMSNDAGTTQELYSVYNIIKEVPDTHLKEWMEIGHNYAELALKAV